MKKIVIVQCRLGSTRLPQKALKQLDTLCVLEHVLLTMKKVNADYYYVATDFSSFEKLKPIVEKHNWNIFAGSETDVLDRFCSLLEKLREESRDNFPEIIIRATADNPFLFYDVVNYQIEKYEEINKEKTCDYFTISGLPHGSGVEILKVDSLLNAIKQTDSPYDHEHVGPALYNHQDKFSCIFEQADSKWNYPNLRTTIDTYQDYLRANAIISYTKQAKQTEKLDYPLSTQEILEASTNNLIEKPILLCPNLDLSHGSGHFRRCLELSCNSHFYLYYPQKKHNQFFDNLIEEKINQKKFFLEQLICQDIPQNYFSLIIADEFKLSSKKAKQYSDITSLVTIDEGNISKINDFVAYSLNIIPSKISDTRINKKEIGFIPLPQKYFIKEKKSVPNIKTVLIILGGADFSELSINFAKKLIKVFSQRIDIKIITSNKNLLSKTTENIHIEQPSENISKTFCNYDLIITQYGFTAFEAVSVNTNVLTVNTSKLHSYLAKKNGFTDVDKNISSKKLLKKIQTQFNIKDSDFIKTLKQNNQNSNDSIHQTTEFLSNLSQARSFCCPVCQNKSKHTKDRVVSRDENKTIRFCRECSIEYISFLNKEKQTYEADYFYKDYQKQYGKTYVEDFESIKKQCLRRHQIVKSIYEKNNKEKNYIPSVLDIGCAFGPYLSAANDCKWNVYGLDISKDAVDYVKEQLGFSCVADSFPSESYKKNLGKNKFEAITMWYVIEHFENVQNVLNEISNSLSQNGIFAFSTPSSSGVSANFSKSDFFKNSPLDHFSIFKPKSIKKILKPYGIKVVKLVSTGQHPERFPFIKKHGIKKQSFIYKFFALISKIFFLGDTFEVYCVFKGKK